MGNTCKKKMNSSEKMQYDHSFAYNDLPPPAPPNGRDDLWELQFCRWWGWNWVRKREVENTTNYRCEKANTTKGCVEKTSSCRSIKPEKKKPTGCASSRRRKRHHQRGPNVMSFDTSKMQVYCAPKSKSPPQNVCSQQLEAQCECPPPRSIPTKKEFKDMCRCLLGKKRSSTTRIAQLYRTPSASKTALDRLCCGVGEQTVMPVVCGSQHQPKTTRRESMRVERCQAQSWSKNRCEVEEDTSEEIASLPLCSQKQYSSTEESVEYLSVRLQHIKSDMCCPCHKHTTRQKIEKCHCEAQTSVVVPKKHRETQTVVEKISKPCKPVAGVICGDRQTIKLKGKKHKTICICVCCCSKCNGHSKSDNADSNNSDSKHCKGGSKNDKDDSKNDKNDNDDPKNDKGREGESKGDKDESKNQDPSKDTGCCGPGKSQLNVGNVSKVLSKRNLVKSNLSTPKNVNKPYATKSTESLNKIFERTANPGKSVTIIPTKKSKTRVVTYPLIKPVSTTKILSKFGTPSQNYTWMQSLGSDETTDALNMANVYKSPVTGKTYNFPALNLDSLENTNLPDLMDITENLSCLKKIPTIKSDDESRLVLDAVCDAILEEHDGKPLEFMKGYDASAAVTRGFTTDYKDLEILCNLQNEIKHKIDVYTNPISYLDLHDIGVQPTNSMENFTGETTLKVTDIDSLLNRIMANNTFDSLGEGIISKSEPVSDDFIKVRLSRQWNEINKKAQKRGAADLEMVENDSKKVKQESSDAKNDTSSSARIENVFTKIEDIVKRSKLKSAEIQNGLKDDSVMSTSECLLQTHSMAQDSMYQDKKSTEFAANFRKKVYMMSSDAHGNMAQSLKPFQYKGVKNYVIYDKFSNNSNNLSSNLNGISEQEQNNDNSGKKEIKSDLVVPENPITTNAEAISNPTESQAKLSRLSVHSFTVCDEKSCPKGEKKIFRRKMHGSCGSLIPVRKVSKVEGSGN